MRRCIRSLLLSVIALLVCSSSAQACLFFPLLDPLNWCCGLGCSNPYATRRIIDDWLGYGYMRGTANGSLGHYPLQPWSTYAPMYPRLHSPFGHRPWMPPLSPLHSQPGMMPPAMTMPFGIDPCDPCPQPLTRMPIPIQVPVTTYRPVTVDRGGYQMVWVPRPVTELLPQTVWQTQYIQPNRWPPAMPYQGYQMPMGTPLPMGSPYPMGSPMLPSSDGCCGSASSGTAIGAPVTWQRPVIQGQVTGGFPAAAPWQHQAGVQSAYPVHGYSPHGYQHFGYQHPGNPATLRPAYPYGSVAAGDIGGDHEYPAAPMTGMRPVIPNAWSGNTPMVRTSMSQPFRTASANRYPHSVR